MLNIRIETDTGTGHIHIPTYFTVSVTSRDTYKRTTVRAPTDRYTRLQSAAESIPSPCTMGAPKVTTLQLT